MPSSILLQGTEFCSCGLFPKCTATLMKSFLVAKRVTFIPVTGPWIRYNTVYMRQATNTARCASLIIGAGCFPSLLKLSWVGSLHYTNGAAVMSCLAPPILVAGASNCAEGVRASHFSSEVAVFSEFTGAEFTGSCCNG